jgi:hypothetical protein
MKINNNLSLFPAALAVIFMASVIIIISPLRTKTLIPIPTGTESNQKLYKNFRYNFEFMLPAEIKYLDDTSGPSSDGYIDKLTFQNFPISLTPDYSDGATFQMIIYVKKNIGPPVVNTANTFVSPDYIIVFENNLNKTGNKDLFNQILSTFKFTE